MQEDNRIKTANSSAWVRFVKFAKLLIVLGALVPAFAQAPRMNWEMLGDSHVDGTVDHDKVKVKSPELYRALRFQVEDAAVEFHRVVVTYKDGTSQRIPVRSQIAAGRQTRVIRLGGPRPIKDVEFWYARGNFNNPRKPHVIVLGMR